MSVLKAGAATGVRSLSAIAVETLRGRVAEPPADPRIGALTAELTNVQAAFAAFRKHAATEINAARRAGLAEARKDEDRGVAKLESGVTEAVAAWRERLDGLERLAATLAETALAKLFDDHADFADLVARTLAKRVRAIETGAAIRVRVSARDFGDEEALHALAVRVGLPVQAIVAETDEPAGACEIDLAVGHLDLTVADQWRAIQTCLMAMATGESA